MANSSDSSLNILIFLSIAQLFGLSLWFVTNAIINQLTVEFHLGTQDLANLSIAVTFGFVVGGLFSAISNISDIIPSRLVFFMSSFLGSLCTLSITFTSNISVILLLRFLTGVFLAGMYPVGMKITAGHFKYRRGLAIGTLLSALTIGSGLPYIFLVFGEPPWRVIVYIVSTLAIIGGVLVLLFVNDGPYLGKSASFSINASKSIFKQRSVLFSILGYWGHMWELYAFWVWFPQMYLASLNKYTSLHTSQVIFYYALSSFSIFLLGGFANIAGGSIADNIGRSKFNILALSVSGLSGLVCGFFFRQPFLLLIVGLIWGISIIPDSPQYSSMITEVCDQSLVGSALAIQTASGFLLTIISISLIPKLVIFVGWEFAMMILSIGPMLGIIAMFLLRREDDAIKIAHGRK